MTERSSSGHALVSIMLLVDRLRDRWLATPGHDPACTVLDVLDDLAALGCERAGAMAERERGRT